MDICIIDRRSILSKHLDFSTYGSLVIVAKANMNSCRCNQMRLKKYTLLTFFCYAYVYIWHAIQCSHRNLRKESLLRPCLLPIIVLLPRRKGKMSSAGLPATPPHCRSERLIINKFGRLLRCPACSS